MIVREIYSNSSKSFRVSHTLDMSVFDEYKEKTEYKNFWKAFFLIDPITTQVFHRHRIEIYIDWRYRHGFKMIRFAKENEYIVDDKIVNLQTFIDTLSKIDARSNSEIRITYKPKGKAEIVLIRRK